LDLSLPGPDEPTAAGAPGEPAADCADDCLEGASAAVCPLSSADGGGQAPDRGHDRYRAGKGGVLVGDRPRGQSEPGRMSPDHLRTMAEVLISTN